MELYSIPQIALSINKEAAILQFIRTEYILATNPVLNPVATLGYRYSRLSSMRVMRVRKPALKASFCWYSR